MTKRTSINYLKSRSITVLDVNEITGSHYIGIHVYDNAANIATSEVKVYSLKLVKYGSIQKLPISQDVDGKPALKVDMGSFVKTNKL